MSRQTHQGSPVRPTRPDASGDVKRYVAPFAASAESRSSHLGGRRSVSDAAVTEKAASRNNNQLLALNNYTVFLALGPPIPLE